MSVIFGNSRSHNVNLYAIDFNMSESIYKQIEDRQIEETKKRIGNVVGSIMETLRDSELSLGEVEIVIGEIQARFRNASRNLKVKDLAKEE